ncbi:hypothetical protein RYX36_021877 [Vicia faba]
MGAYGGRKQKEFRKGGGVMGVAIERDARRCLHDGGRASDVAIPRSKSLVEDAHGGLVSGKLRPACGGGSVARRYMIHGEDVERGIGGARC